MKINTYLLLSLVILTGCASAELGAEVPYQQTELSTPSQVLNRSEHFSEYERATLENGGTLEKGRIRKIGYPVVFVLDDEGKLQETRVQLPLECYDEGIGIVDAIVIRTQADYDAFLESFYATTYQKFRKNFDGSGTSNGKPYAAEFANYSYGEFFARCNRFPAVDFSQYTLLGKMEAEGCQAGKLERHIYSDDAQRLITYKTINYPPKGPRAECKAGDRLRLIRIPKIPTDYQVRFLHSVS